MKTAKKFTKNEFEMLYPNEDACLQKIFDIRFGSLTTCPHCKEKANFKRVTTKSKLKKVQRKSYQCLHCSFQLHPLAGTIFEKTTTSLYDWFYAIYLFTETRNGVAAKELERTLNVCYKTALRMAHQIKILMSNDSGNMFKGYAVKENIHVGEVQADETFIGGLAKNMHKEKKKGIRSGGADKMAVFGMLSGDGKDRKVLAKAVSEATYKVIAPIIRLNLSKDATLITDSSIIYRWLRGYERQVINHEIGKYVVENEHGRFHTNSIENLWSALKRMIKGTHIHVSQKHLQKYVDECVTRYLLRHEPEKMFETILNRVAS